MLKVFKLVALSAVLAVSLEAYIYVPSYTYGGSKLNNMVIRKTYIRDNYQRPSSLTNRPCAYSRWGC